MKFRSENNSDILIGLALVAVGLAARVAPHPDNFTPVTAIALFAGVVLPASIALTLPLIVMIASDLYIGPHDLFWLTWASFAAVSLLGAAVSRKPRVGAILLSTLAGSLFFFFTTNLGVFLFENMYPKTVQGLVQCFVMALPFLKNSLAGDLFYSAVLFGGFAAAKVFSTLSSDAQAR